MMVGMGKVVHKVIQRWTRKRSMKIRLNVNHINVLNSYMHNIRESCVAVKLRDNARRMKKYYIWHLHHTSTTIVVVTLALQEYDSVKINWIAIRFAVQTSNKYIKNNYQKKWEKLASWNINKSITLLHC